MTQLRPVSSLKKDAGTFSQVVGGWVGGGNVLPCMIICALYFLSGSNHGTINRNHVQLVASQLARNFVRVRTTSRDALKLQCGEKALNDTL